MRSERPEARAHSVLQPFPYGTGETVPTALPRVRLDGAVLSRLHCPRPWRSLAALAGDWLVIAVSIWSYLNWLPVWTYPLIVLVIASRQHALGILVHEAAHRSLFPRAGWNDRVADWLAAFPLFITLEGYRREHLAHHRHTGGAADPDFDRLRSPHYRSAATRPRLVARLGLYGAGVFCIRDLFEYVYRYQLGWNLSRSTRVQRLVFFAMGAAALHGLGVWTGFLLFWVVPMNTALLGILYFRLKAEHEGVPPGKWLATRNVHPYRLEGLLLAPHNVNLHLDHHLFPGVPYYHLPALHAELCRNPDYRRFSQQTRGYFKGAVAEICPNPE